MLIVVVAVLIGGISGFIGGKPDLVVQRFVDAWMAFRDCCILLNYVHSGARSAADIVVLGNSGGIVIARGAVIGVKENDYFLAARAVGTPLLINCNGADPHHLLDQHWRCHHCRGLAELSRIRAARRDSQLGESAQPGRAEVHGAGALAGVLARSCPDDYRLLPQHVRRRHQGPARSPATGR